MAIERESLDKIARSYVSSMTSIRGRRVHRLLMREFVRYDHVFAVTTAQGVPALLAIATNGAGAVCPTDGSGESADVIEWTDLIGATVTSSFDLKKDSLPILAWTLSHPGLERVGGWVIVRAAQLSPTDQSTLRNLFRGLGTPRVT